jgi:hypothetical protein
MHRPLMSLALTAILAASAGAQSQMSGSVRDSAGRAVPGAQVSIPKLEKAATTDDSGRYVLRDLPAGSHSMDVKRAGYKLSTANVDLGDNEKLIRDFVLLGAVAELEAMRAAEKPAAVRPSRTVISAQQIEEGHYDNVFAAIEALRPQWLKSRGTSSFSNANADKVWVYQDNVKVGDVETLRSIPPKEIVAIRYFDGNAAQGRFGVGHSAGAIVVETAGFQKNKSP